MDFYHNFWKQCSLPINKRCLGLILTAIVASSLAFISSMYATSDLRSQILPSNNDILFFAIESWISESSVEVPLEKLNAQKYWLSPVLVKNLADIFVSFENDACQKQDC